MLRKRAVGAPVGGAGASHRPPLWCCTGRSTMLGASSTSGEGAVNQGEGEGPGAGPRAEPGGATPALDKTRWLTLHPVIKWTMLVDVARRAPYLLSKPASLTPGRPQGTVGEAPLPSQQWRLAAKDPRVHFSPAATAQHARLCAALPYPARLLLTLSLSLWLRSLRDVQDTLSRVRLPYAPTQRLRHVLIAHVCPTRLQEYWCDHYTSVCVRMDPQLNSTAEQVPAPHAWDPATSETVEDSATESTIVLQGHRRKGLLGGASRAQLVRQIQGTTARASDDDALAARVTGSRTRAGHERRRLAAARARDRSSSGLTTATASVGDHSLPDAPRASPPTAKGAPPSTAREHWSRADSRRMVAPVRMDVMHDADARYHHNVDRGEGCPVTDTGALQFTPVHIAVPTVAADTSAPRCETQLRGCVMAHAAILSALFIEGRTVQFTTDDSVVFDYVACTFEAWIADHYLTAALVDRTDVVDQRDSLRPYYPSWCFRVALVVLPPRQGQRYRPGEVRNLARVIVQAAPCAVMVHDVPVAHAMEAGMAPPSSPPRFAHVQQLQEAVRLLQTELYQKATGRDSSAASTFDTATRHGGWLHVAWVPVRLGAAAHPGEVRQAAAKTVGAASSDAKTSPPPAFRPKAKDDTVSTSGTTRTWHAGLLSTVSSWLSSSSSAPPSFVPPIATSLSVDYLAAVAGALEGGDFYAAQVVYVPDNCAYTSHRLRRWILEKLPSNVRVVGVNTSPLDLLYFYPQAPFLTAKVGNNHRYRAVDLVLVEKFGAGWAIDPLRAALGRYRWARGGRPWDRVGLHAGLALSDRAACVATEMQRDRGDLLEKDKEEADNALVWERCVEYLANPGKGTLVALAMAKLFGV